MLLSFVISVKTQKFFLSVLASRATRIGWKRNFLKTQLFENAVQSGNPFSWIRVDNCHRFGKVAFSGVFFFKLCFQKITF